MKDFYLLLVQSLIFLTENGLFIVTDYQATTNEFDSISTVVKRKNTKTNNQKTHISSLDSPLLTVRMNKSCLEIDHRTRDLQTASINAYFT